MIVFAADGDLERGSLQTFKVPASALQLNHAGYATAWRLLQQFTSHANKESDQRDLR